MDGRTGSFRFWAVTIMLVIVTAFCCAGTVMSRTDFSAQELEHYDRERNGRWWRMSESISGSGDTVTAA